MYYLGSSLVSKIKTSIPTFFYCYSKTQSSHVTTVSNKLKVQQCDSYAISALKLCAAKHNLWTCEKNYEPCKISTGWLQFYTF